MVRFDEMLDSIVATTKSVAKAATQKTGELVGMGKLKMQEQSVTKDIEKAYTKLGAIVYEAQIKGDDLEPLIKIAMEEITELNQKLDSIEKDIEDAKEDISKPVEVEPDEDEGVKITLSEDEPSDVAEEIDEAVDAAIVDEDITEENEEQ